MEADGEVRGMGDGGALDKRSREKANILPHLHDFLLREKRVKPSDHLKNLVDASLYTF